MFVTDRFVYLELHKTGCTHIRDILHDLLDGEFRGKHNQVTPDLFTGEKVFLGSIRDPWDWYTSLWGFGCDGKGGVFGNVTNENHSRNPQAWKSTYSNINEATAFRKWLRMMHDEEYMADIGEGYSTCSVSQVAGLMTYRYLVLLCTKSSELKNLQRLSTMDQIINYENENCFIDHFVRNESLEVDLLRGLEQHGVEIESNVKSAVLSKPKSNTSSRTHGPEYYYDLDSENLVARRERLIIEKFGYVSPSSRAMA